MNTDTPEIRLLTSDRTIHKLEKLDGFLRGMTAQKQDVFIEDLESQLSTVIYCMKELKKKVDTS